MQQTRTQFFVLIWLSPTPAPYAKIPIFAKMPLAAMAFAMRELQLIEADYVLVCWDDPDDAAFHFETDFWHIKRTGEHLTYDRAASPRS